MPEPRISWRPATPSDHVFARESIAGYMDHKATFVLFENGTALMLKPDLNRPDVIAGAMSDLKFKTDFKVMPMKDGSFLVWLASPVCVFIGPVEAGTVISALKPDPAIAMLPGENFLRSTEQPDHMLIGLAGRAKAHLDAVERIQVAHYVPSEA
jgi:hypothetical protein